jgi:peptidoglycan hydrolase-like protein with peptidoglycan-binding domain
MISRFLLVAALLGPAGAFAAEENQAQQPPEAQPAPQVPADPYMDLNKQVQEKLQALGLYDGPVNGDFGFYTQAALAQFQLSVPLPASGMLDEETIAALGIRREATASVGASQQPPADQPEQPPADQAEQPATQLDRSSQGTVEASAKER